MSPWPLAEAGDSRRELTAETASTGQCSTLVLKLSRQGAARLLNGGLPAWYTRVMHGQTFAPS